LKKVLVGHSSKLQTGQPLQLGFLGDSETKQHDTTWSTNSEKGFQLKDFAEVKISAILNCILGSKWYSSDELDMHQRRKKASFSSRKLQEEAVVDGGGSKPEEEKLLHTATVIMLLTIL
jgi:hypothetical protein